MLYVYFLVYFLYFLIYCLFSTQKDKEGLELDGYGGGENRGGGKGEETVTRIYFIKIIF